MIFIIRGIRGQNTTETALCEANCGAVSLQKLHFQKITEKAGLQAERTIYTCICNKINAMI
jgi:hypothetical protein